MVVIRSGDNRQGVCPLKFLQEVWHPHFLDKDKFEGRTFYSQLNSSTLKVEMSNSKNQPNKPDVLPNQTERHSIINSYSSPGNCDQYTMAPAVVQSTVSIGGVLHDLILDKDNIYILQDIIVNPDSRKVLRRRSLARNLIPISSSTRPLGLPSSCSPSHYERKLSRYRYRNIKNITSLSRPLLIG